MAFAVEVIDLVKFYGKVKALDGLSFNVSEGEIFGLVGPNGAGKTTTLRIIATLLKPSSGIVRVFGHDVVEEADEVRKLISYLPEEAGAYRFLTGREYLEFMAKIYHMPSSVVEEGIKISGLGAAIDRQVRTYSKGMKRRLLVARTLMVKPKLAILDEPTSGLDVAHALYVRNTIRKYAKEYGVTVFLSSHNMLEVEYLCDRVALINKGRIVDMGATKELLEKYGVKNLEEVFIKAIGGVA